ncbi:HNH endonuclease [Zhongshania sp.]|uniref:HNH endonuclease n=1 Tax=Zhongshania sp. TaxID=1971902 RepID=UPI00356450D5
MTPELIRELVFYNPDTGDMIWRERDRKYFSKDCSHKTWNTKYAGKPAVTKDGKGYRVITIFGKRYLVHRLAWLYMHGEWPEIIDHINGDKLDNRLCNLRSVTQQQNHMNNRLASNNTSGVTGVYFNKLRAIWCAQMKFNGETYHLGSSPIFEEAVAMRKAEEKRLGFSKRHGEKSAR